MSDFAHRVPLDRIGEGERIDLVANADERRAVAERLRLVALDRLDAHAVLTRDGDAVRARGRLKAMLQQSCVATGQPIPARIDEAFDLRFVPASTLAGSDDEVELGADQLEIIFHDGAGIDLGTAIADTLALAIDPYPRSAEAEEALRQAGVISEEEAGPFAALAALKEQMKRD